MDEDLQFKAGNPGAVQYGNFINYYDFHPPEERIKLLPTDIWKRNPSERFVALDIGCNAGNLTLALHKFLHETIKTNVSILGVDIDPVLIERANEQNQSPDISFECLNFMNDENRTQVINNFLRLHNKTRFDLVFCFSTTMWIHLNNGDDGLMHFLGHLCNIAEMLVVEPQPWKCYRTAMKRVKGTEAAFPFYKKLKISNNVESDIVSAILNLGATKVWESERTAWKRKVFCFNCTTMLNK